MDEVTPFSPPVSAQQPAQLPRNGPAGPSCLAAGPAERSREAQKQRSRASQTAQPRDPNKPPRQADPAPRLAGPGRLAAASAFLLAAVLLAGCAAHKPAAISAASASALRTFVVSGAVGAYRIRGSARLSYRGETQSGELLLDALPGPAFHIQLRAPLTGSLALDVRIDATDLLVVDYVRQTYVLASNTPEMRTELFSLDLSPLDLQIAMTGRVEEGLFQAAGGTRLPGEARFHWDGADYRFILDAQGLPEQWVKLRDGVTLFRVEYRGYLDAQSDSGPPVRLPQRIRIYAGQPEPRVVLGVQDWQLPAPVPAISFIPPADVLERFRAE